LAASADGAAVTRPPASLAGTMVAAAGDTSRDDSGLTPLPDASTGAGGGFSPLGDVPSRDTSRPGDKSREPKGDSSSPDVASPDVSPAPDAPQLTVKVTVPALTAVGSSVDEATLRDIFSGKVVENADAIASLTATNITIPEIDVAMNFAGGVAMGDSSMAAKVGKLALTLRDITFDDVANGIARSVSIGSVESRSDAGGVAHVDKMAAEQVNLGLMLQLYGLIKGDPSSPLSLAYSDLTMAGATVNSPEGRCTFGKISAARVEARPLKASFGEISALAAEVNAENGTPSRQAIGRLVDAYADLLSAFRTSPVEFGGFDCDGVGDDAKPFKFSVGGMTVGAFGGAHYPDFIVRDVAVGAGDKGTFSLGEFHLKGFDLSSVLAAARALAVGEGDTPTEKEFRGLIPPFVGFGLSDVAIDVPDEEDPGQRIKAKLADFDLDLGNYVNGIPSQFASHASHVVVALPSRSSNSGMQTLISAGLRDIDVSYDLAAYWDAPSKEIRLTRFSIDGLNLGRIEASAVVGQVDDSIFSMDADGLAEGLLDPTVKRVSVHVLDAGLGDLLAKAAAGGSGKGVAEIRRSSAALVQATLLFFLGGAANSADVSAAVGKFTNGARSLSISALANDPAGVAFHVLEALTSNPADIGNQITIDAVAR
jgi:hypothetical protein